MIQRRAVLGVVIGVAVSLLGACGFESPDVQADEHASVQAADFTVSTVHAGDAFVTPDTNGTIDLVVTFVNESHTADALTGVATPIGSATIRGDGVAAAGVGGGALTLPPKEVLVEVGTTQTAPAGPNITIAVTKPVPVGAFVPVTFTFHNAGTSPTIEVPVVPSGETTSPTQLVPTATASVPTEVGVSASD